MRVDAALHSNPIDAAGAAQRAERLGYDGLWCGETSHDVFVAAALAATATTNLEVGTAAAIAFSRNPMSVAIAANDLQLHAAGRFTLGLGTQVRAHIERRYSMPWSRPAARMKEFVLAVRAIFDAWASGGQLDFEGDFYHHTLMTPFFCPGPNPHGAPPILLAAVGERMTEVAGDVGDGVLVHGLSSVRYLREVTLPALERGLVRSGRNRADVSIVSAPFVVTGATEQQSLVASRQVRDRIAFYASTPSYLPVLALHGWESLHDELRRMASLGAWAEMGDLIDDSILTTFAVVAEPDALATRILERFDGLLDRVSLPSLVGLGLDAESATVAALAGPIR